MGRGRAELEDRKPLRKCLVSRDGGNKSAFTPFGDTTAHQEYSPAQPDRCSCSYGRDTQLDMQGHTLAMHHIKTIIGGCSF